MWHVDTVFSRLLVYKIIIFKSKIKIWELWEDLSKIWENTYSPIFWDSGDYGNYGNFMGLWEEWVPCSCNLVSLAVESNSNYMHY